MNTNDEVELLEVPGRQYLMIDGSGDHAVHHLSQGRGHAPQARLRFGDLMCTRYERRTVYTRSGRA